jgi:hypothetical protein
MPEAVLQMLRESSRPKESQDEEKEEVMEDENFNAALDNFLDSSLIRHLAPTTRLLMAVAFEAGWESANE